MAASISRMILFMALTVYLILAPIIMYAMESTYHENLVTGVNKDLASGSGVQETFGAEILVSSEFIWINLVLFVIPLGFWIFILAGMWFPAANQGD